MNHLHRMTIRMFIIVTLTKLKNMNCKERKKYFAALFSEMDSSTMWKILIGNGYPNSNIFRYSFNVNEIIDYLDNVAHIEEPDITNFVYFDDEPLAALCKVKSKPIGKDGISILFTKLTFLYISGFLISSY